MTEFNLTKHEEKELLFKALFGSPFFNILASVLATFVVGALFFRFGGGVPITVTSTSTEKLSTFEVSGEGSVTVVPDEARVLMGVRKAGANVEVIQEQTNAVMQQLSEELKKIGIRDEDIRTTNYSVSPDYAFDRGSGPSGYVVYAQVEVRVREMEKTSQVLDLVGQLGLEQVGGISFGLSEELEQETIREARKQAIEEAKTKAQELAKLAGMKLGKIINVQENSNMPQPYMAREVMAVGMDQAEDAITPTPVEPGSSEIRVSVTLSYETN